MHPTECCNGSISRLEHQSQNTFHLHEYNLLVYAARTFKTVSLALCEHSKRGPVGPEATPTVSTGLAVDAKLTLLTDSIGLVCLADDKVALLTPKEGSETTALKANEEPLTADVPAIIQPTESSRSVVTGEKHIESHLASRGLTHPDPEILVRPSGKTNKDNEMWLSANTATAAVLYVLHIICTTPICKLRCPCDTLPQERASAAWLSHPGKYPAWMESTQMSRLWATWIALGDLVPPWWLI